MPGLPKLVLLILLAIAAWTVWRWLHGVGRQAVPRRPDPRPPRPRVVEDLVACGVCGSYVSAQAPSCARRDCPRPR